MGPNSRILGIDDSPFAHRPRASVTLVGVLMRGGSRLEGVLSTRIVRDGFGATAAILRLAGQGRLAGQAQAVLLDGLAVGGFNIVDIHALAEGLGVPVLSVMRKEPNLEAIRRALAKTSQPERRWKMLLRAGPIHRAGPVLYQVAGADNALAERILEASMPYGFYPEVLRVAHLIGGGIKLGVSRGRA